jgi:hypothetical protein
VAANWTAGGKACSAASTVDAGSSGRGVSWRRKLQMATLQKEDDALSSPAVRMKAPSAQVLMLKESCDQR